MKVVFYSLPSEIFSIGNIDEPMPPLAIYLLGACAQKVGFNVEVYDSSFFHITPDRSITSVITNHFSEHICDGDVLCFSCNSFNWGISKLACRIAKSLFNVFTIVGGLHPSYFFSHAMLDGNIDFVLRGEGEKTLPELLNAICNKGDFSTICGLSYRNHGEIIHNSGYAQLDLSDFSSVPMPLFDLIPEGIYQTIPVESSRGCFFNCVFCSIPNRNNRREFSLQEIERRLDHASKYASRFSNTKLINFCDDCFTCNPDRFNSVFDMLKLRKDGRSYFIEARVNDLLKPGLDFTKSNLHGMQIGVECGYNEGIRRVRKGTTVEALFKCADLLYKKSLIPISFFSFIIGFPWESEAEINMTLDTIEILCSRYDAIVSLNWLILLPSDLWEKRESYGITLSDGIYDRIAWMLDKDYFDNAHPHITQSEYSRIEHRIVKMQLKGYKINHPVPNTNTKSYAPEMFK